MWGYVRSTLRGASAYAGTLSSAPPLDDAAPSPRHGHGGGGGLQSTQAPSPPWGSHSARRHAALHPGPTNLPHPRAHRTRRHPGCAPQRSQRGGRFPFVIQQLHACAGTFTDRPQYSFPESVRSRDGALSMGFLTHISGRRSCSGVGWPGKGMRFRVKNDV